MILAASDANGDMKLIEPNGEMPPVRLSNNQDSVKKIKSITDFVKIDILFFLYR